MHGFSHSPCTVLMCFGYFQQSHLLASAVPLLNLDIYPIAFAVTSLAPWISVPSSFLQGLESLGSQLPGKRQKIIGRGEIKMDQISLRRQKYE